MSGFLSEYFFINRKLHFKKSRKLIYKIFIILKMSIKQYSATISRNKKNKYF